MPAEPEPSVRPDAAVPAREGLATAAEAVRERVWRRERRGDSHVYGPVYRSGFLAAFLAGRLEDGADLALATGSHARHYPYAHPRSKWDDLLLVAGADRFLVAGRRVSALGIVLGPGPRATIGYHGRAWRAPPEPAARHARGAVAVDVHLHLELDAVVYHPRAQGVGLRYSLCGLQWQPAFVRGSGSLTLDGRRRRIDHAAGLVERGSLTNLRGKLFQFGFDYLAVSHAAGGAAAYVRFAASPLHAGLTGLPLRLLLAGGTAREELTLGGPRARRGDVYGLAPRAAEPVFTLIRHQVELGPGTLERELLAIGGAERRYALRQSVSRARLPAAG